VKKDYRNAADEFRRYLARQRGEKEAGFDWISRDHLVRSLIRNGKPDEALKVVAAMSDDETKFGVLRPLASAATGDVNGTLDLIRRRVPEAPWYVGQLYRDEDLGPMLASPKFAAVRKAYPEPAPHPRVAK
jgi:pentatricopeptide repeat protein